MEKGARKRAIEERPTGHWNNLPREFKPIDTDHEGFIYHVYYKDILVYIGKKSFWSWAAVSAPGGKRKIKTRRQSEWKSYTGSSKELNKAIRQLGKADFTFKVVYIAPTKIDLTYYEVKDQMEHDVLLSPKILNDCILGKFYKGRITKLDKLT